MENSNNTKTIFLGNTMDAASVPTLVKKKVIRKKNSKVIIPIESPLPVTIIEAAEEAVVTENAETEDSPHPPNQPPTADIQTIPKPEYLAIKNAHERDPYIVFDEGPHEYTVRGEKGYTSVTTWNHSLFEAFDEEKNIKQILKNRKWKNDTEYKYYKKTPEEIKQMWEENRCKAAAAGTKMHFDIECYYNNIPVTNESIEFAYFSQFAKDYSNLEAYRTEWCVYHEELKLSGSIDMVFRDKETGHFYIYDWKRSREIAYESYGDKTSPVPCISHLPDVNFWHYSLQLNTYRFILEEKYNFKIHGMYLVCLHPDNIGESYERIEVHDLRKEVNDLMDFRRKILSGEIKWEPAHHTPTHAPIATD